MSQLRHGVGFCPLVLVSSALPARAFDQPSAALSEYFPPPEEQGGWRSLLPAEGEPDDSQKARIREIGGVNYDSLKAARDHNAAVSGATGLLVIRHGHVGGEWYKEGDPPRFPILSQDFCGVALKPATDPLSATLAFAGF